VPGRARSPGDADRGAAAAAVPDYPVVMLRIALALVTALVASLAGAEELAVGSRAPDFSLVGSDGEIHTLAQHRGERGVVLAWFPKAFTPG